MSKKVFSYSNKSIVNSIIQVALFMFLILLFFKGSIMLKVITVSAVILYLFISSMSGEIISSIEVDEMELVLIKKNNTNKIYIRLDELDVNEVTTSGARGMRIRVFQFSKNNKVVFTIQPNVTGWTREQLLNIKQEVEERKSQCSVSTN